MTFHVTSTVLSRISQGKVTLNKGQENEFQFNVKPMLLESHVSTANEEVEWFPVPHFKDENVNGTFRHVNCLRVGYAGSFTDGMCQNCSGIESINTSRCKVWRRFKESQRP